MRIVHHTVWGVAALLLAASNVPAGSAQVASEPVSASEGESAACAKHPASMRTRPTVVLVHGANAESSSWHDVIVRLQRRGYPVIAYANPLRSLTTDAQGLRDVMKGIEGPIVLVGHSYGGMVISVAAAGNDHVKSLVFVDAHLPLPGETTAELTNKFGGSEFGAALIERPVRLADGTTDTDLYVDPTKYRSLFTGPGISAKQALALAAVQRPVTASALNEPATAAAWRHVPSWDVIGTKDTAIPPAAQLFMARRADAAIVEIAAPHAAMLTFPCSIANVIEDASR